MRRQLRRYNQKVQSVLAVVGILLLVWQRDVVDAVPIVPLLAVRVVGIALIVQYGLMKRVDPFAGGVQRVGDPNDNKRE